MRQVIYLDQNAWIELAKGSWEGSRFPECLRALRAIADRLQSNRIVIPLSFVNIYETMKVNDAVRRAHLANVQTALSRGIVLRGRRRILEETMMEHIARHHGIELPAIESEWFLSKLWFEAAADYSPERFDMTLPSAFLDYTGSNPEDALFETLVGDDEEHRQAGIRGYSASSMALLSRIEARRSLASGESFAMRRRIYSARLVIDEFDFICGLGQRLGLSWKTPSGLGVGLVKSLVNEIPIMLAERELVLRLEDQSRLSNENDLRDMAQFTAALPLANIVVGEKPFMNMARQAGLDKKFETTILTSIHDLVDVLP